ncbi:pyridoxamine 5'-phosphate oxidase family protein [Halorientalis halophila]|uniref:pyridoxamine 5'-phosphate oxidase family protein n=1 Tax=Halorientalis halophila TaxID=3108499 RepID=UPI003009C839
MTVDDLGDYGMHRMTDEEVTGFLSSQSLGTLGLNDDGAPYLLPLSYGFDGGSRLYFYFVVGEESRKATLADRADGATFLVFSAETSFNWESVLLSGTIRKLPDSERPDLSAAEAPKWRPDLFESASETEPTLAYEFRIDEWSGVRHTGLPPGLADPGREASSE